MATERGVPAKPLGIAPFSMFAIFLFVLFQMSVCGYGFWFVVSVFAGSFHLIVFFAISSNIE